MKHLTAAWSAGFVFALGLALGGMTDPEKVIAFLDFFGDWDPSLAFVMAAAVAVYAPSALFLRRRSVSILGERLHTPPSRGIDRRLVLGAMLFGAGWGLVGFCPGPALVSVAGLQHEALLFVASMLLGMGAYERTLAPRSHS